jgi:uncharacterized surface protein with fasciclin (FAS1) repeats
MINRISNNSKLTMTMKVSLPLLLLSLANVIGTVRGQNCSSTIAEVVCTYQGFGKSTIAGLFNCLSLSLSLSVHTYHTRTLTSFPLCHFCGGRTATFCDALEITGLNEQLESDVWTVFAPTDDAFAALGDDNLAYLYNDTATLTDLFLFHVIPGVELSSSDLPCVAGSNLLTMANGDDTRTLCVMGKPTYQKGTANPADAKPAFLTTDIVTCDGVIHVIDQVLLDKPLPYETTGTGEAPTATTTAAPSAASAEVDVGLPTSSPVATAVDDGTECSSITDVACGSEDFDTLCTLLIESNLTEALSGGMWTVFAPTEDAFAKITVPDDADTVTNILLFHVVPDAEIFSEDLVCTDLITMGNGKMSRTVCRGDALHQKGNGNSADELPLIITANVPVRIFPVFWFVCLLRVRLL